MCSPLVRTFCILLKGTFRHLPNHAFSSPLIREYISHEGYLFFENFQNSNYISKMPKKSWENVFPFRDKCISIGYLKLFLLRREYFWSTVNVLKSSHEILPIIKRDFFKLNCLHIDQQMWYKWCNSDFSTSWSALPCWLSKGPLKCNFFDIYLTTFFGIRNFGNTSAMRVVFCSKCSKFYLNFKNAEKN